MTASDKKMREYKRLYWAWFAISDKKSPRAQTLARRLNLMYEEINKM